MTNELILTAGLIALLTFAPGCGEERDNPEAEQQQQQQELPENAIGFSGSRWNDSVPASRATSILTDANIDQMTVYAYYTGTGFFNPTTSVPDIMLNQSVTRNAAVNGDPWTYQPTKYWPTAEQRLSFVAITYAPTAENGVTLIGGNNFTGYPSFRVTPPATPSQQKDIGVAQALNRTSASDAGKVPLGFNHAMHKLNFSAKYIPPDEFGPGLFIDGVSALGDDGYMKVTNIEFGDVLGSGTLNVDASTQGFSWTDINGSLENYALTSAAAHLIPDRIQGAGLSDVDYTITTTAGTLMLVPEQQPNLTVTTLNATFCDCPSGTVNKPYDYYNTALPSSYWKAGEATTHNFSIKIQDNDIRCWGFVYTGRARTFVVPHDGTYKLEVWGASGGGGGGQSNGGKGGYSWGEIDLIKGEVLYIYVGEAGKGNDPLHTTTTGLLYWNGGGVGGQNVPKNNRAGGGGGGTDFRTVVGANWYDVASLSSRFLVAGGGGGKGGASGGSSLAAGVGGGIVGTDGAGLSHGMGGTQSAGGMYGIGTETAPGKGGFGYGGYGGDFSESSPGAGGGGGWYGGGGSDNNNNAGAGGGSGFVAGITAGDGVHTPPKTFAAGNGGTVAGNVTNGMPNHANPGNTMTGNTGNGYARITLLQPTP